VHFYISIILYIQSVSLCNLTFEQGIDEESSGFVIVLLLGIVQIAIAILAGILASRLNRSVVGCIIGCLFVPHIFGFILLFLGKNEKNAIKPDNNNIYNIDHKQCSSCGRQVPMSSQKDQNCPFCGAYWGREEEIFN